MMDFIAKYWLEVVFGAILAGFGAAFRGLSRRVSRRIEEQEAIKLGMQALLRDRIIAAYHHCTDRRTYFCIAQSNFDYLGAQSAALVGRTGI